MTKLIWLLVLVASAAANDIQGVLPQPADKPQENVVPMIQIDPMPPQFENGKDLKPETFLRPIGPIFPSFLQPGKFFDQMGSLRNGELNLNQKAGDDASMDQPEKGILTIILVKSNNDQADAIEDPAVMSKSAETGKIEEMKEKAEQKFKTLTQFILHDLFGAQTADLQKSGEKEPFRLLGGSDDPDQFIRFSGGDGFGENDFIRFVKGNEMPVMSDDLGRHREFNLDEDYHADKKCNFMKFLRLKAHVHYRTIVHLFFISGIILIILMFLSLTLRVNKRRNALMRYANKRGHIDVASIDSAAAKQREAEGLSPRPQRAFRLGNLMMTFEQRMAPPAYDQIDTPENQPKSSSLVKSLAGAYKNRYQPTSPDIEEDRKSLSSLPPYEEKPESKN